MCRVPLDGISWELLYGVPLLASVQTKASAQAAGTLLELVNELRGRQEGLLLVGHASPMSLVLVGCHHFFVAFAAEQDGRPALALRGIAFADNWQPEAMLTREDARGEECCAALNLPLAPAPGGSTRFDPHELRRERVPGGQAAPWAPSTRWAGW